MGIGDEIRAKRFGVRLSAQRLFTNRDAEKALFDAKLDEVRSVRQQGPDWATDVESPRRNVLVFYGYAGIGKTRLSRELERDFIETPADDTHRVAVRIDFSEPSSRDSELFLFTLRAGLARLADTFPAFDTALTLYWARQHPGTSMTEFVRHQSVLGGLTDRATLAEHLRGFTLGLIGSAGGPAAEATRRLAAITWDKIQENRTVRRLERDCPFFQTCVSEDDLDELRLHLPLLLAWDLSQLGGKKDIEVAVFLDTFEHISHGRRRSRKGDLEDAISRGAFFLPGVTFVVTTRSKLAWGSTHSGPGLEYFGPSVWPGLAGSAEDDQQEVGVLPLADCERYLATCLRDEAGQPVIAGTLRSGIAELSSGVPLYLDVAVNHYLSLLAGQRTPLLDDFTAGIPEIVMRLMEDLDEEDTDLLRVAALLGVFDASTLRAALPDLRSSRIQQFLGRSFVLNRGDGIFSVHELLQTSVRTQDAVTSHPWSTDEWRQVEERLVGHWSEQFRDRAADLWRDRRAQALAFWQLCVLYATTDVEADVLAEVIMLVQLQGVWTTLDAGSEQPDQLVNQRGVALLQVLDGVLARQVGSLERTEQLLTDALKSPALSDNLARLGKYYLAETRDLQSQSPSLILEELAEIDDRIGTEARIAHAHALLRDKDLVSAQTIAEGFSTDVDDPEICYRLHELHGHIGLFSGQFELGADHFEMSRQVGEAEGSALLLALGLRHLALTLCWREPEAALGYLEEAEILNRDLGLPPGIGQCLMTRAVISIGSTPPDQISAMLTEADATFTRAGYLDDAVAPVAIDVLAAAATGDEDLALHRREVLSTRSKGRRIRTWLAAADAWTGHHEHFDQVSWPQGQDQAYAQWKAVLTSRLGPEASFQPTPPRLIGGSPFPLDLCGPVEVVEPVELVETTVDLQVGTGDVAARLRVGEEIDRLGHVIRRTETPERHHRLAASAMLRSVRHPIRPGVHRTGRHRVDPDPMRTELTRKLQDQHRKRSLRRGVVRAHPHPGSVQREVEDDRSARSVGDHPVDDRASDRPGSQQRHVHAPPDLCHRQLQKRPTVHMGDVVDEDRW